MNQMPATLTYSHAIANPWDNSIAKPFERRTVQAVAEVSRCDDGFSCSILLDGRYIGGAWEETATAAIEAAMTAAEYNLMDASRSPFVIS